MIKINGGGAEKSATSYFIERRAAYSGSSCFLYAKGGECRLGIHRDRL